MSRTLWSHLDFWVGCSDLGRELIHEIGFHELFRELSILDTILMIVTVTRVTVFFLVNLGVVHGQILRRSTPDMSIVRVSYMVYSYLTDLPCRNDI